MVLIYFIFMGVLSLVEKLKRRFCWLVSSHYKMERFGVTFLSLTLCMIVLMGTIVKHKADMDKETLGTNVVYTNSFTMSLSQNRAEVVNIFSNQSQTKCFILLRFPDMSNVVTDASQYKLFLTGSDMSASQQAPLCNPTATIYMFGVTGYMGIYLVDMAGFQSQILDLVLRCNILTGAMPSEIPTYEDASFAKFDQGRMYFNPGASGFTVVDFLDNPSMSVGDIYNSVVVKSQETTIRDKLTTDLKELQSLRSQIDEYARRVSDAGIIVPVEPVQIRGDIIETLDDGRLELKTDYILQGGYDFDWYNGSVKSGYLDGVVGHSMTASRYIASQRKLVGSDRLDFSSIRWLRSDGTDFYSDSDTIKSQSYTQIDNSIKNLQSAWQSYYDMKKMYQISDLESLLLLELDTNDMSTNYTVNSNDNIVVYG